MELADLTPGWRTDFILHREGAIVTEHDDCIVVRTPAHPTHYWGNFLLLPATPADADLGHWLARFEAEVGAVQPASEHVAIGINANPNGERLPAWEEVGFEVITTAVLALRAGGLVAPARDPRGDVRIRTLELPAEIESAVALQCADPHGFELAGYADFRRGQMQRYSAMASQQRAAWFGLWYEGVHAAGCGLMRDAVEAGAQGRFQHVATHPDWRRRGLCRALVHAASAWGFECWGLERIVMCADPDDIAIGIYEALGFARIDTEWCLQRNAPRDRAALAEGGA
jgi:ribosomal protein S18 acetylase RimI-like enzyme